MLGETDVRTTIRTYGDWRHEAKCWAASPKWSLLGVFGNPGLSKTHTLRLVLGSKAKLIRCHGTGFQLYKELWAASQEDAPILLDDVDALLKETSVLNMLKGLFDSDAVVQWNSSTSRLKDERGEQIPREFSVRAAKIGVISNDERIFSRHLSAVEDRGLVVHLNPDAYEVHKDVEDWWTQVAEDTESCPAFDREVFDFIGGILDEIAMPSQRAYLQSARLKRSGSRWQRHIQDTFCLDEVGLFIRDLMCDSSYTAEDRAEKFIKKFSSSRPTYFRHQAKVEQRLGLKPVPCDYTKRDERIKAEAAAKLRVAQQEASQHAEARVEQTPMQRQDAEQSDTATELEVTPEESLPSNNGDGHDDVQVTSKKGRPRKQA
jgi:hypothetical protein